MITEKVEKRGNQWCVIHCHGPDAGKAIKCFDSEEKAQAMHRAIQANQSLEISVSEYVDAISQLQEDDKPPKAWWDNCTKEVSKGMPSYSQQQVDAVCGWRYYHHPETGKESLQEMLEKVLGRKRP